MVGSFGSFLVWNPSPPATMNQSLVRTPQRLSERDGPQCDQLSCVPPHTL